jgi:hypothetical protein
MGTFRKGAYQRVSIGPEATINTITTNPHRMPAATLSIPAEVEEIDNPELSASANPVSMESGLQMTNDLRINGPCNTTPRAIWCYFVFGADGYTFTSGTPNEHEFKVTAALGDTLSVEAYDTRLEKADQWFGMRPNQMQFGVRKESTLLDLAIGLTGTGKKLTGQTGLTTPDVYSGRRCSLTNCTVSPGRRCHDACRGSRLRLEPGRDAGAVHER